MIQPNSGRRDYSRSSCDGWEAQLGGLVPGSRQDAKASGANSPMCRSLAADVARASVGRPSRHALMTMIAWTSSSIAASQQQGGKKNQVAGWITLFFGLVLWLLALIWAYVEVPAGPMPSPRSGSPPGKMEVAVGTDSYCVTATTLGTGSSMASMIVVSTGAFATCLLCAVSGGRFFMATGFFALLPVRWTLDFAFFGVACFAAIPRVRLALALSRFELFLRAATRFFVLAMAISCKAFRRLGNLNTR